MSKSNATETDLLKLVFTNTAPAWAGIGNLWMALHTADPGEDGDQSSAEAAYTGYARMSVSRDATGWTVAAGTATNAAQVQFGMCTAGSATITHVSVGSAGTGPGQIFYSGALASPINVSANVQPQFAASALLIVED